jgi:tight adherence protein B
MSILFFALLVGLGLFLLADGLTAGRRPVRRGGTRRALHGRLQRFLDRAGLRRVRPWEFLLASAAAAALGALVAGATLRWPVLVACAALAAGLTPTLLVAHAADQRLAAQQDALPDALDQLRDMLNGGLSLQLGLRSLEQEGPEVLRAEIRRITRDLATTGSFALALAASRERMAEPLWDLVTATLLLEDRKGADRLSAAFDELARDTRARLRVIQEVRAYRVRTEWTARLLACLPLGLLVAGRLLSPTYFQPFDDPQGQLWLGGCVVLIGLAYGLMHWIGRPPAEPRVLVAG